MATRLEISFPTIRETPDYYRVYIDDSSFMGSSTEVEATEDGFTLTYDGDSENILDPVKGSTLRFTIAVTDDTQTDVESLVTDLIGAAEGRFTIRVDHNTGDPLAADTLFWCGYILPDLSGFEDHAPPYALAITATDGLARLKTVDYSDTSGSPIVPYGNLSFLDHILNCLNEGELAALYFTGTDIFLRTSVNWVDDGMGGSPVQANCPLEYSRVNGLAFAEQIETTSDDEFKYMNCYDVLKAIMEHWQCRILFSGGAYLVQQMGEVAQDTFYERRFALDGTAISNTSTAGYNANVPQTSLDRRLAGGVFNYLPALKKVTANWNHESYTNFLKAAKYKWITLTNASSTVTIEDITTDSNTYFLISLQPYVNVYISDPFSTVGPWRYVLLLQIKKGSYYLTSSTYSIVNDDGFYFEEVGRTPDPPTWSLTPGYYEMSTDFVNGELFQGAMPPVNIITPPPPTGTDDILINIITDDAYDLTDTSVTTPVIDEWKILNPEFIIFKSSDPDTLFETDREYTATNDSTGNSDAIEVDMIMGSNAQTWTPSKMQTSSDLATWADSDATWQRDSGADVGEFGDLWVKQAIALRKTAPQTYSGTFYSDDVKAHSRIVMPDSTAWLMSRVTFTARELMWQGEWIAAGISESDITVGTKKKKGLKAKLSRRLAISNPPKVDIGPQIQIPLGMGPQTSNGISKLPGKVALMALTANTVSSTITAATITSIPVTEQLSAGAYLAGDHILITNPLTGEIFTFEVSTTSASGDTAIAVTSKAISSDIPTGARVIYSTLNRHTNTGGSPGTLPAPTNGAILRAASGQWSAYSGANDGYVLTWNNGTSTWEEQAVSGTGDILDGGNSTAATIVIGTNDANSLSLETNNTVGWTMDTGQLITMNASNAATSTAVDRLTIQTNSTGTAAAGFGGAILFQGESSTTDNQDMARLAAVWTTATHASREAKLSIQLANSGASLLEMANFNREDSASGSLTIGTTTGVKISNSSLTTAASYTVGNSSSNLTVGGSSGAILISCTSTTNKVTIKTTQSQNTGLLVLGDGVTRGGTGVNFDEIVFNNTFSGSGTGTYDVLSFNETINATATGAVRSIVINPTLTALGGTYYAIDIAANSSSARGVYQSGASTINNFVGATAFGTTSAPSGKLVIIKQASTSDGLSVIRSSSTASIDLFHDGAATVYSQGGLNLNLETDANALILLAPGGGSSQIRQVNVTPASDVTAVFGNTCMVDVAGTYAPTTSGGDFSMYRLGTTINQTGTADQVTRGVYINPTLTAVASAGFRAVDYPGTTQHFLYQGGGTGVSSYIQGSLGVGTGTSTPSAKAHIISTGTTSATTGLLVANSTPTTILAVRDDQRVGVLTGSPSVTLDVASATDSIALPEGTTAQRPSVNNSLRMNSDADGLEVRYGAKWHRLTCQVAPSIAAGAAAGTGPTVSIDAGNDLCHQVSVTTGTSATTGTLCTVTFNQALDSGLFTFVVFSARNANAAGSTAKFYIGSAGNTSYTIDCASAPADSTQYTFHVFVKQ